MSQPIAISIDQSFPGKFILRCPTATVSFLVNVSLTEQAIKTNASYMRVANKHPISE
jgi:hypothetical protein